MTEKEWDDIDGGWEDVELDGGGKKRRTRARGSRGKRRATSQVQPDQQRQQAPHKRRDAKPKPATQAKPAVRKGRPWLLPVIAFGAAIIVFVLFLLASKR